MSDNSERKSTGPTLLLCHATYPERRVIIFAAWRDLRGDFGMPSRSVSTHSKDGRPIGPRRLSDLERRVRKEHAATTPEYVQKLYESMPARCQSMFDNDGQRCLY